MKLLYVVHRYAPYPGGSEIYVQGMAEESLRRGHTVAVFAGEHKGNYNGVTVTSDNRILLDTWDLIIVHGGDVNVQNFVLSNATRISSPILYLLVLPSNSVTCVQALYDCAFIGCSTRQDFEHCEKHKVASKAVQIRHGITWQDCIGKSGFKSKHNITGQMFLSCGGYWPNKAMRELAAVFESAALDSTVLVTTGYDNRLNLMPQPSKHVLPLLIDDRQEVLSAIYDADCLIMHSWQEGFGLVLLESMLNQTPWLARKIAGAEVLEKFGKTYTSDQELVTLLKTFNRSTFDIEAAYNHVSQNHLILNTVDDIEACINIFKKVSK
jgi:glycosyltransferase involved in cell wall biosynthesis